MRRFSLCSAAFLHGRFYTGLIEAHAYLPIRYEKALAARAHLYGSQKPPHRLCANSLCRIERLAAPAPFMEKNRR